MSGLGGIGKTHIAIEYAYRYHQEYEIVLWAGASNQETLTSSYNTIATLLQLPERAASEQEIIIEAVKKWLQTHKKWLLILDNADDPNLLPPYLPPISAGHILGIANPEEESGEFANLFIHDLAFYRKHWQKCFMRNIWKVGRNKSCFIAQVFLQLYINSRNRLLCLANAIA